MTHEKRVWIAQCLCPKRHAILAATVEADTRDGAEIACLTPLREHVRAGLAENTFNPWCGLCKAPSGTWTYELARTRFRSMREATPELIKVEQEQAITRLLFGDGGKRRAAP